jgi:hypothetical protein
VIFLAEIMYSEIMKLSKKKLTICINFQTKSASEPEVLKIAGSRPAIFQQPELWMPPVSRSSPGAVGL